MLDPKFKAKWVEALESGEYDQARQLLHDTENGGYCCLGVACKVAGAVFKSENNELHAYRDGKIISDENTSLATTFLVEIGLTDLEQQQLYHMNDSYLPEEDSQHVRKHSFKEIAAYIKENF